MYSRRYIKQAGNKDKFHWQCQWDFQQHILLKFIKNLWRWNTQCKDEYEYLLREDVEGGDSGLLPNIIPVFAGRDQGEMPKH
jgi:hypothetical protein